MPPIIEVDRVSKEFILGEPPSLKQTVLNSFKRLAGRPVEERPPFKALDDVSFSVQPGEVLGIIGQNGAGKSTLLKILAGISSPTRGEAVVRGRVAPLIEVGAGLIPDMTGRENIFLNAIILGMRREDVKRRFDEMVAFAELEEFIDTPVKRYSSGMRVRLGFAIATSVSAEILIVDEVLAVGDLAFQRKCFDRMESLIKSDGRTVLLVSHNIRQVERMCSRVLFLDHGRVRQDGPARAVCNAFYEYSDQRIVAQSGKARNRILASTGEVELTGFTLVDPAGQPTSVADYRDDLAVRFSLLAHRPLKRPIFVLGVHTTDFVNISTTTSLDTFRDRILAPGKHDFTVRLQDCPLTPGAYSLRLSVDVEEPVRNIFYSDGLNPFNVRSNDELARSSPDMEGFFRMHAQWSEHAAFAEEERSLATAPALHRY